ncbi:MAG TPA: Chromate resistance protein ChrB [Chloroflexota bacterium]|nr:Chromate resistance protein ChrB [Chloroflexota bacterium]
MARHEGGWLVLVYRVPVEPSNARVSVWRELKRLGALYLQQCVCVVPNRPELAAGLARARDKIARFGGSSNLFVVPRVDPDEEAALIQQFRDLSAKQYAEIVEECETKFVKEVEFETCRENFTFAEAEEIEQDLDKVRRWFQRVQERDWFGAEGSDEVRRLIARCEELLEGFYAEVHARAAGHAGGPDASEVEHGPR